MRAFDYVALKNQKCDSETVAYIAAIHEAKGKQELHLKHAPQELDKLVGIAKVQSAETSNAIEGSCMTNTRLKQLLSDKTTPRTRDEEEIVGYRDALRFIHENYEYISLAPNYILQLHKSDCRFCNSFLSKRVFAHNLPLAMGIKFRCKCGVVSSMWTTAEMILSSPYRSAKKRVQSTKNCCCSLGDSLPKNSMSEPTTKEHMSTASLRTFVGRSRTSILPLINCVYDRRLLIML